MYESPIKVTYDENVWKVTEELDDLIVRAVIKAQVNVDKYELLKALAYDRSQYDRGYEDGYRYGFEKGQQIVH